VALPRHVDCVLASLAADGAIGVLGLAERALTATAETATAEMETEKSLTRSLPGGPEKTETAGTAVVNSPPLRVPPSRQVPGVAVAEVRSPIRAASVG
jgi:hypothetical protein